MKADVLIIGGGLAGLACAVALSSRRLKVLLVERSQAVGGRARSWEDETTGDIVDLGPHVLLTEYPNLLRFLEILGTRDRIVWDSERVLTIVDRGRAVEIRRSLLPLPFHLLPSLMGVPTLPLRDLLSNHNTSWFVMRASEDELRRLDDVDALTFLRRMKARPRLIDWFWATVSMAIMNVPLAECSAGALMRFYRILLANPDLHMGFADGGLAELYALQASRLIEQNGSRILTRAEAKHLDLDRGVVKGALLNDGTRIDAETTVCAVEPDRLLGLLPDDMRSPGVPFGDLEAFEPSPYVSLYLWFDRKLTRQRNWARTWAPDALNYDFYDLSNIRRGWDQRPSVIASNIIHAHRAEGLPDSELIEATIQEIGEFLPDARRAEVRHARVHRIAMAVPCPHPGMERRRPAADSPWPGLFVAGDWTDTGLPASMEGAVRSGFLAAEAVLRSRGCDENLAQQVTTIRGLLRLTSRGGTAGKGRASGLGIATNPTQ